MEYAKASEMRSGAQLIALAVSVLPRNRQDNVVLHSTRSVSKRGPAVVLHPLRGVPESILDLAKTIQNNGAGVRTLQLHKRSLQPSKSGSGAERAWRYPNFVTVLVECTTIAQREDPKTCDSALNWLLESVHLRQKHSDGNANPSLGYIVGPKVCGN